MTFLEHVFEHFYGPKPHHCPFCESGHFSIRPSKINERTGKPYPIKYRCFTCQTWGDEQDLALQHHPKHEVPTILAQLRREYETADRSLPRGPGQGAKADSQTVALVWSCIHTDIQERGLNEDLVYEVTTYIAESCAEQNVPIEALLAYWKEFRDWVQKSTEEHAKTCTDPKCGYDCRRLRGLEN